MVSGGFLLYVRAYEVRLNFDIIFNMKRDVEKVYTNKEFVKKLRRLADSIEKMKRFSIQVAGKRVVVPNDAIINVEHEKEGKNEEIEFQIKWINK